MAPSPVWGFRSNLVRLKEDGLCAASSSLDKLDLGGIDYTVWHDDGGDSISLHSVEC